MVKHSASLRLIANRKISDDYFVLELSSGEDVSGILPGQFVQVLVENSKSTFLRRPISVYDYDSSTGNISLLIKIAGDGTRALSLLKKGDSLDIIYPLGNSFTMPSPSEKVLLVGGGVGVAPIFLLGKKLRESGLDFDFILGYRTAGHIIEAGKFSAVGNLNITTEDGSHGIKGFVTDHPLLASPGYSRIYCCGPEPMMRAVSRAAAITGAECEVSLEQLMACGFGVCLCCIVETVEGNLCTCTDGPVFNVRELKWQI